MGENCGEMYIRWGVDGELETVMLPVLVFGGVLIGVLSTIVWFLAACLLLILCVSACLCCGRHDHGCRC
jgi:hypothetical protein